MRTTFIAIVVLASLLVPAVSRSSTAAAETNDAAKTGHGVTGIVMWTRCSDLAKLSDADLQTWKRRGVAGFGERRPQLDAYQTAVDVDGLCGHESSVFAC